MTMHSNPYFNDDKNINVEELADRLDNSDAAYAEGASTPNYRLNSDISNAADALRAMAARIAALEAEVAEQCRLNGMGSEREARLMAQLAEAKKEAAELERRRGGECDTCGGWVCPPLRCVGCMMKQQVTPNADPSGLLADSLKKQDADIAELRSQLAAATRRAEEAERAAERLAQDLANCISGKEEAQRAVEVMRSGLEKIAEHKDCGYGYYHGGDPRDFRPDEESCTPEELTAHKAACDAFDAADAAGTPMKPEPDGSGWVAPGIHVTKSKYRLGVSNYPSHCAEIASAALAATGRKEGE